MGKIHDLNGSWLIPLTGVAVLAMLMAVFGLCAGAIGRSRAHNAEGRFADNLPNIYRARRAASP